MTPPRRRPPPPPLDFESSRSLAEVLSRVLDKGAVVDAELTLGLANVDLVYVRLAALVSAVDRILGRVSDEDGRKAERPSRRRRSKPAKARGTSAA